MFTRYPNDKMTIYNKLLKIAPVSWAKLVTVIDITAVDLLPNVFQKSHFYITLTHTVSQKHVERLFRNRIRVR